MLNILSLLLFKKIKKINTKTLKTEITMNVISVTLII